MKCDVGYYNDGTKNSVKANCNCNGVWEYNPEALNCKRGFLRKLCSQNAACSALCLLAITCGEPPSAPEPNGKRLISEEGVLGKYAENTVVNYSCPDGYGLRGIPFRVCDLSGEWSTLSGSRTIHLQCISNRRVKYNTISMMYLYVYRGLGRMP